MQKKLNRKQFSYVWRLVGINLLVLIIFLGFYLIPGLSLNKGLGLLINKLPPTLICLAVVAIYASLVMFLYIKHNWFNALETRLGKLKRPWKLYLIILGSLFVIFLILAWRRYANLGSGLFDFALEHQVVWNTSQGRLFVSGVEVANYLGDHVSLLTLIPSAIYSIIPTPLTLSAIQILCVLSSAYAIKLMADSKIRSRVWSLLIFFLAVFYIGFSGLIISEYRAVVLGFPFISFGLYFVESRPQKRLGWVLLLLGALAKEDMAVLVGSIGLYQFLVNKQKRGAILAVLGYAWALFGVFVIIPMFRGAASDTLARYSFSSLLDINRLTYFVRLFFPLLFLPLLSWRKILVMLPNFALNLVSSHLGQYSAVNQYDLGTGLIIFWAMIDVVGRIKVDKTKLHILFVNLVVINLFLLSGHLAWRYVVSDMSRYQDYQYLENVKARIPTNAILAATSTAGGIFGDRQSLQMFDDSVMTYEKQPDYIIIDKITDNKPQIEDMVLTKLNAGYIIWEENKSFLILKK